MFIYRVNGSYIIGYIIRNVLVLKVELIVGKSESANDRCRTWIVSCNNNLVRVTD